MPVAVAAIVLLEFGQYLQPRLPSLKNFAARLPLVLRWAGYFAVLLGIILFGVYQKAQFIYFQF